MTEVLNAPPELTSRGELSTLNIRMDSDPISEGGNVAVADRPQASESSAQDDIYRALLNNGISVDEYHGALISFQAQNSGRAPNLMQKIEIAMALAAQKKGGRVEGEQAQERPQDNKRKAPQGTEVKGKESEDSGALAEVIEMTDQLLETTEGADLDVIKAQLEATSDDINYAISIRFRDRKTMNQKFQELNKIFSEKDPRIFAARYKSFLQYLDNIPVVSDEELEKAGKGKKVKYGERGERLAEPLNIQDLAEWIIQNDSTVLWGRDGKYPLLKTRKDRYGKPVPDVDGAGRPRTLPNGEILYEEELDQGNFLKWVRSRAIELHNDNPTDPMSPLTAVAIETSFKNVPLIQMKYQKQKYFADRYSGQLYQGLMDQVINEAWLFGVSRNADLAYRSVMHQDEELPKVIAQIHAKNEFTRSSNLQDYMSMPSEIIRREVKEGNEVYLLNEEKDSLVGDAFRFSNSIYRNISNIDWLKHHLWEGAPIMSREGFKNAIRIKEDLPKGAPVSDDHPLMLILNKETGEKRPIFDKNGNAIEKNLLEYLNIWDAQTFDESKFNLVRELVRLTIAQKFGLDTGLDKYTMEDFELINSMHADRADLPEDDRKLRAAKRQKAIDERIFERKHIRINAEWAELNSHIMMRWSGMAALNDITKKGFDAFAKLAQEQYLIRQSGTGTSGPIGNPEVIGIFKNLGLDMFLAIKTESGKTPYQIFEDVEKIDNQIILNQNNTSLSESQREEQENLLKQQRDAMMKELRFGQNTQLDYASNHISRAFQIYHSMTSSETLGLDRIVTKTGLEGVKYNRAEFEAQIKDKFIKQMRYAYKSNSALDYGVMMRALDVPETLKTRNWTYKEVTVAEYMFSEEVIGDIRADAYKGKYTGKRQNPETGKWEDRKLSFEEYLSTAEARDKIVKNLARARIAGELRDRRYRFGTQERWNITMVERFVEALETLEAYEMDPENPGQERPTGKTFFTHEDMEWIREHSNTNLSRMLREDLIYKALPLGLLGGSWDLLKIIFGSAFK